MTEVDEKKAAKILFMSDRTCCVCRIKGKKVQIHHIDGNHENHDEENLAILCLECHDDTLLKGGFDRKLSPEQVRMFRDDWIDRVEQVRAKLDEEIIKSKLQTKDVSEISPIIPPDQNNININQRVRDLITRIGREKISNLLQEAKLIAIDSGDHEMESWIKKELEGYAPPEGKKMKRGDVIKLGFLPEYRDINGKILIAFRNQEIYPLSYPILMGQPITWLESALEQLKKKNVRITISYTFGKEHEFIGGKTGDVEIPETEIERIIKGVEQRLSQFLEQKLSL